MWPAHAKDENYASSSAELYIAAMNTKTIHLKVNMTAIIAISTLTHKTLFLETLKTELQEKPQIEDKLMKSAIYPSGREVSFCSSAVCTILLHLEAATPEGCLWYDTMLSQQMTYCFLTLVFMYQREQTSSGVSSITD